MRLSVLTGLLRANLSVLFLLVLVFPSVAEESLPTGEAAEAVVYPEVRVTGEPVAQSLGETVLTDTQLNALPRSDSTIVDALDRLPNIQQSGTANVSTNAAEVLPAEVSISGAKPFDSQYQINGIGLNSVLDPAVNNPFDLDLAAEPPSGLLINSRLIGEVKSYTYDVPARYGGFTGGVVDARIRPVSKTQQTRIYGRGTSSSWTSFHISDENKEDAASALDYSLQEEFIRGEAGFEIDLPLSEKTGLLIAASRSLSLIDRTQFGEDLTNRRELDNYLLKLDHEIDTVNSLSMTGFLLPYTADFDRKQWLNSSVEQSNIDGGLTFEWNHQKEREDFTLLVGLTGQKNRREAPNELLSWRTSATKTWPSTSTRSLEGGPGDVESQQWTAEIKADYNRQLYRNASTVIDGNLGLDLGIDWGSYERLEDRVSYNFVTDVRTVCNGDPYCVDAEQYSDRRIIAGSDRSSGRIIRLAPYGELKESFTHIDLKQGLRLEYDDYNNNLNVSPRASVSLFPFADRSTELFSAAGIYYGRTLLSDKLREGLSPFVQQTRALNTDNTLQDWSDPVERSRTIYSATDVDTPYTQELAAGLKQDLWGGRLELVGLMRRTRDELHRETITIDGERFFVLNNLGRTDYESVSLSFSRDWLKHQLIARISWQDTESTDRLYDDPFDQDDLDEDVVFEGKVTSVADLPRSDYNIEWTGQIDLISQIARDWSLSQSLSYRNSTVAIVDTRENDPEGRDILVEDRFGAGFEYDLKLQWLRELNDRQGFAATLEVLNVFNHNRQSNAKITASGDNVSSVGRQFWLGLETWF